MARKKTAFTLVELLVAMAIIAVLIGLAIGAISLVQRVSRDTQRRAALQEINAALQAFYGGSGAYPSAGVGGVIKVGTDVQVGSYTVEMSGVAQAANATNASQTRYCYALLSDGYLLGAELEDGSTDFTQSTTATANQVVGNCGWL